MWKLRILILHPERESEFCGHVRLCAVAAAARCCTLRVPKRGWIQTHPRSAGTKARESQGNRARMGASSQLPRLGTLGAVSLGLWSLKVDVGKRYRDRDRDTSCIRAASAWACIVLLITSASRHSLFISKHPPPSTILLDLVLDRTKDGNIACLPPSVPDTPVP